MFLQPSPLSSEGKLLRQGESTKAPQSLELKVAEMGSAPRGPKNASRHRHRLPISSYTLSKAFLRARGNLLTHH